MDDSVENIHLRLDFSQNHISFFQLLMRSQNHFVAFVLQKRPHAESAHDEGRGASLFYQLSDLWDENRVGDDEGS